MRMNGARQPPALAALLEYLEVGGGKRPDASLLTLRAAEP
jgi:hypothetical protein